MKRSPFEVDAQSALNYPKRGNRPKGGALRVTTLIDEYTQEPKHDITPLIRALNVITVVNTAIARYQAPKGIRYRNAAKSR